MRLECPEARICWQFDGRCNTYACRCRHKAEHLALIKSLDAAKRELLETQCKLDCETLAKAIVTDSAARYRNEAIRLRGNTERGL